MAGATRDRKEMPISRSTRHTRQQIADHELRLQALEGERA
jgi:hypothetical protein